MNSIHKLCQSTWGASFQKARHTADVRPAMAYGGKVWSRIEGIDRQSRVQMDALEKIQNTALRRITGAYKSVPACILQQEAEIPPLGLYIQQMAFNQAHRDQLGGKTTAEIEEAVKKIQSRTKRQRQTRRHRRSEQGTLQERQTRQEK